MDPHPTTILPEIISALLARPPNWLLPNWTTSWGSEKFYSTHAPTIVAILMQFAW